MKTLRKTIEYDSSPLITLPKDYENKKLEVIVLTLDEDTEMESDFGFDFSDISGNLKWKGDALLEQKKLRNEW